MEMMDPSLGILLAALLPFVLFSGVSACVTFFLIPVIVVFHSSQFLLGDWVLLISCLAVFPLTSYLVAVVLERYALLSEKGDISSSRSIVTFALLFTFALVLQSNSSLEYIFTVANQLLQGGVSNFVGAWLSLGNAVVFCVVVAASTICFATLLFELPMRWLFNASKEGGLAPLASCFRLLLIITVFSLSLQLCIGLFVHELHPAKWLF